jgi:hypothetical protein
MAGDLIGRSVSKEISMFDSLADRDQGKSHMRERFLLVVIVLVIAVILFAALYIGVQALE